MRLSVEEMKSRIKGCDRILAHGAIPPIWKDCRVALETAVVVSEERDEAVAKVEKMEGLLSALLDQFNLRDTDSRTSAVGVRSLGQLRKIKAEARAALDD